MDEYLEKLEVFYDQKMKYLTHKDKFIKCNECESTKSFLESKDEIILSCGSGKDNECGPQIIIKLPKYIYYESTITELKKELNNDYNWKSLERFLNVSDKVMDSEKKKEKINNEIKRIEKLFFEKDLSLKQKHIQDFYDHRIRKTKECKDIIKKLNEDDKGTEEKKSLRKQYIILVQEINNEYEQIQEIIKDNESFIMDKGPEVTILHDNFEYKKIKKEEIEEKLIEKIFNLFIENDGTITREDYIDMKEEGGFKTEWGSTLLNSLQLKTKNHPWKKKEQKKYGPIIKEPESNDPNQIECSEKWMEYLKTTQFKVGQKVSWERKGKIRYGIIKEIKGKGALIEDEKGNEQIRKLKDLSIN